MYAANRYYSAYSKPSAVPTVVKLYSSDNTRFKSFCSDSDESLEELSYSNVAPARLSYAPGRSSSLDNGAKHRSLFQKDIMYGKARLQSPQERFNSECKLESATANVVENGSDGHSVPFRRRSKREDGTLLAKKAQKKAEMISKASLHQHPPRKKQRVRSEKQLVTSQSGESHGPNKKDEELSFAGSGSGPNMTSDVFLLDFAGGEKEERSSWNARRELTRNI